MARLSDRPSLPRPASSASCCPPVRRGVSRRLSRLSNGRAPARAVFIGGPRNQTKNHTLERCARQTNPSVAASSFRPSISRDCPIGSVFPAA